MANAVIYIRVSTRKQADEGVSLDMQERRCRAWCDMKGIDDPKVFRDDGRSGRSFKGRGAALEAIETAVRHKCPLIVYSLSRLARNSEDCIRVLNRLRRAGVEFASLSEGFDTTTAMGRGMMKLVAVVAEIESDQTSERVSDTIAHKKAAGDDYGGHPYGYRWKDGNIVENRTEQGILSIMLEMRGSGWTVAAITKELNDRGISPRKGKAWGWTSVDKILRRAARG